MTPKYSSVSEDTPCMFSCVFSQAKLCDGTTGAGTDKETTEPIVFWFVFTHPWSQGALLSLIRTAHF